jgi:hypothetical protein
MYVNIRKFLFSFVIDQCFLVTEFWRMWPERDVTAHKLRHQAVADWGWGGGTGIDGPSHVHVLLICICRKHWNPFNWGRYKNKWSGLGVRMNWNTSIKLRMGDGGGWGTLLAKTDWNKQNDSVGERGRVRSLILLAEFHSYKDVSSGLRVGGMRFKDVSPAS